jgi:hypothetical protein
MNYFSTAKAMQFGPLMFMRMCPGAINFHAFSVAIRTLATKPSKPQITHPKDVVYENDKEKDIINKAAHNIKEEDLEHDELGMKQHKHEHGVDWKEAEQLSQEEGDEEVKQISNSMRKEE